MTTIGSKFYAIIQHYYYYLLGLGRIRFFSPDTGYPACRITGNMALPDIRPNPATYWFNLELEASGTLAQLDQLGVDTQYFSEAVKQFRYAQK